MKRYLQLLLFVCVLCTLNARGDVLASIVGVPNASNGGPGSFVDAFAPGGNEQSLFSFTINQQYSNISITTLWLNPDPGFVNTDLKAWITDTGLFSLPNQPAGDVFGFSDTALAVTGAPTPVTVFSQSALGPGTYYVLFALGQGHTAYSISLDPTVTYTAPSLTLANEITYCQRWHCSDSGLAGSALATPLLITGTPVPEPSTMALFGAGLLLPAFNKLVRSRM